MATAARRKSLTGGKDTKVIKFLRALTREKDSKDAKDTKLQCTNADMFIIEGALSESSLVDKPPVATVAPRSKNIPDPYTTNMQDIDIQDINTEKTTRLSGEAADSLVQLQEEFPQYSPRYLNECLKHYKYNVEDVLNALNKVSLPSTAAFVETIHIRHQSTESNSSFSEFKQRINRDSDHSRLSKTSNTNSLDLSDVGASNNQHYDISISSRNFQIETITYVKATFDCKPDDEDELHFKIGDVIRIIEKPHKTWWMGEINGHRGLFPSNYVRDFKVEETAVPSPTVSRAQSPFTPQQRTRVVDNCMTHNETDSTIKPQLPPKKNKSKAVQSNKSLPRVQDSTSTFSEEANSILQVSFDFDIVNEMKCISNDEFSNEDKTHSAEIDINQRLDCNSYNNAESKCETTKCETILDTENKHLGNLELTNIESSITISEDTTDSLPETKIVDFQGNDKKNIDILKGNLELINAESNITKSEDTKNSLPEKKKVDFRGNDKKNIDIFKNSVDTISVVKNISNKDIGESSENILSNTVDHCKYENLMNDFLINKMKSRLEAPKEVRSDVVAEKNIPTKNSTYNAFVGRYSSKVRSDAVAENNVSTENDIKNSYKQSLISKGKWVKPSESENTFGRNVSSTKTYATSPILRKVESSNEIKIKHIVSVPSSEHKKSESSTDIKNKNNESISSSELKKTESSTDIKNKSSESYPSSELKKNESSTDILENLEWKTDPQVIKLMKSDQGLGFTIISCKDPLNPHKIAIMIKTIKPGSVANKDGRLSPGDRLEAINGILVDNGTFDNAVATLKGVPRGTVSLSVWQQPR